MKDFESIYSKLCINYKPQVDRIAEEHKAISKEAFKKVFTIFVIAAVILGVIGYYIHNYMILFLLAFFIMPLLIAFFIIRAIKINKSDAIYEDLPLKIYRSVLEELPYHLTYNNIDKMSQEEYDSYGFEKYSDFMSYLHFTGIFNEKNPFKMNYVGVTVGHGEDTYYPFRGYVVVVDLNNDKQIDVMIKDKKHTYFDENMKTDQIENTIATIKELLLSYNKNTKLSCDCKIKNNKLIVRTYGNYYEMLMFHNLLNKKVLKNYYENLYVLFELTNKILNIVEES